MVWLQSSFELCFCAVKYVGLVVLSQFLSLTWESLSWELNILMAFNVETQESIRVGVPSLAMLIFCAVI